jgi:5-formyltetrahydrofolate cyclo-ligase
MQADPPPDPASKAEVRRLLREQLAALTHEQRRAQSLAVAALVADTPEWHDARTIMLYLALPDEVDTADLFARAFAAGKTVAVPRITDPATRGMSPVHIHSLDDQKLQEAHFGVRVPLAEPEEVPLATIDLVVVPGLGFSRAGERIGRGMGYYDRFLARPELRAALCGLAFEVQLSGRLPVDDHDRPMDLVVTSREILRPST